MGQGALHGASLGGGRAGHRVDVECDRQGAGRVAPRCGANESERGFLLNHLISDELPGVLENGRISNSDPLTGQAGWYDVRVRIEPAPEMAGDAAEQTTPRFPLMPALPGTQPLTPAELAYDASRKDAR